MNKTLGNPIKDKSYEFALEIVKVYQYLSKEKKEFVLSKQLLRSGTSIGANVSESQNAFSKKDFIYKLQISYKEASESEYWIRLLFDSKMIDQDVYTSLSKKVHELLKLLTSILKSSKGQN